MPNIPTVEKWDILRFGPDQSLGFVLVAESVTDHPVLGTSDGGYLRSSLIEWISVKDGLCRTANTTYRLGQWSAWLGAPTN